MGHRGVSATSWHPSSDQTPQTCLWGVSAEVSAGCSHSGDICVVIVLPSTAREERFGSLAVTAQAGLEGKVVILYKTRFGPED